MVSFILLASLITSTLDIRPLMATLGWRIVAASSFRFLSLASCLSGLRALSSSLVSYFHLQPFSLSPHLFPPSLVLFGSSFSFVELFPFSFVQTFTVRFSLVCVSFSLLAASFLLALAPSLSGYGFHFVCITALIPLFRPSYVSVPLCFCYTWCFCVPGLLPLRLPAQSNLGIQSFRMLCASLLCPLLGGLFRLSALGLPCLLPLG